MKPSEVAESQVASIISSLGEGYLSVNDCIYTYNDHLTQIDHISISKYGIFIIETKAWNGSVTGTEDDEQWQFSIDEKIEFRRNPLKQNDVHARMIMDKFKIESKAIIKVVVFSDDADLEDIKVNEDSIVIHISQLEKLIRSYKKVVYVKDIYELKYQMKNQKGSDKARRKHLRSVVGKQSYFAKRAYNNRPIPSYQMQAYAC